VLTDEERSLMKMASDAFRDNAPPTAAAAAGIILDGVRAERWRILVGADAAKIDEAVRAHPEQAYEGDTFLGILLGTD